MIAHVPFNSKFTDSASPVFQEDKQEKQTRDL